MASGRKAASAAAVMRRAVVVDCPHALVEFGEALECLGFGCLIRLKALADAEIKPQKRVKGGVGVNRSEFLLKVS